MQGPYNNIDKLIDGNVTIAPDTNLTPTIYDNYYTLMYKFARQLTVPISHIVFGSRNGPLNTIGSKILQTISNELPAGHGEALVRIDIELTSLGNIINKQYFLYEYVRCVVSLSRTGTIVPELDLINSMIHYQQVFSINYVDSSNMIRWLGKMRQIYNYELVKTDKRFQDVINLHTQLKSVDDELDSWFTTSTASIISNVYTVIPTLLTNEVITIDYGDYIFDQMLATDRIPYISYYDSEGRGFHKIFTGDLVDIEPNYKRIIGKRDNKPDTIEFTIWLGKGSIYNATKESLHFATYDLETNKISYFIPASVNKEVSYYDIAYNAIMVSMNKFVRLSQPILTETALEFNLYPMRDRSNNYVENGGEYSIEEFVILDKLTFDENYRNVIYPNEVTFPYNKRSRYEFLYSPMFMADFNTNVQTTTWSLTLRPYEEGLTYPLANGEAFNSDSGNYLRIRIFNAKSEADSNYTIEMLTVMLAMLYRDTNSRLDPRRHVYTNIIPYMKDAEDNRRNIKLRRNMDDNVERASVNRDGVLRMKEYKQKYPEFYTDSYPLTCQTFKTPMIFETEQSARVWAIHNGKDRQDDVLPYPANNPKFWFGCPNFKYPYPNIVANEDPNSREIVPYFPCCSSRIRTKPETASDYNEFYKGTNKLYVKSKLQPGKYLETWDVGKLEKNILFYLNTYTDGANISRIGVTSYPSPNSLLHCILYAIKDSDYIRLYPRTQSISGRQKMMRNLEQRESYVRDMRIKIGNSVHLGCMKQETYDAISLDKIKSSIESTSTFMDSKLYYHMLEEALGINLFIFDKNGLEIPRHRVYSVRHVKIDRPTIILYRNNGPAKQTFTDTYSHYEIIVDRETIIFGNKMTKYCIELHNGMINTTTYNKINNKLIGFDNMYSLIDYHEIFGNGIQSQILDGFGKLRGLNVLFTSGLITIFVPPNQPLNLPLADQVYKTASNNAVISMNRQIKSITKDTNGRPNGIWFSQFDIVNYYYIQINDMGSDKLQELNKYPLGPIDIAIGISESNIVLYEEQRRTASVLKQLVLWVYDLGRNDNFPDTTNQFLQLLRFTAQPPRKSAGYYKLSEFRRTLPIVKNFMDAMIYISKHSNIVKMIDGGYYFVFHNQVFRDKMSATVIVHSQKTNHANNPPVTLLKDYRVSYKSFKQMINVEVFVSNKEFNIWLHAKESGLEELSKVNTQIHLEFSLKTEPYIYRDEDGRMYLIQNIIGISTNELLSVRSKIQNITNREVLFAKAMKIARVWNDSRINIGNKVTLTQSDNRMIPLLNIITYNINIKNQIFISNITTGLEKNKIVRILQYMGHNDINSERNRYAAILPLN